MIGSGLTGFARSLVLCLILLAAPSLAAPAIPGADQWAVYRERFVTEEGRVVDTGNKQVSHTEGQGWAMLFAETFDDRPSFDKIWDWTREHLQRRGSALFAWRWDPGDAKNPVADPNNASDGDILIAWALSRAAHRWHEQRYRDAARPIIAAIRADLLAAVARRLILLPALRGFTRDDGSMILSPSYYVYPALREFCRLDPSYEWRRLRVDGLALLGKAQFGQWRLTPDWISVDPSADVSPAAGFDPRFGFGAIRVPLYLIWAGLATAERLAPYLDFWASFGNAPVPAWTDVTDNSVAPYAGSSGMQAIVRLVRAFPNPHAAGVPAIDNRDDYYSASLLLLAQIVGAEAGH